ncbi:hypothetical protein RvY_13395 [Ramazzottius varieornatus]|uniref:Transmembrane protein 245 n=1 Tax=Ramazzottius varieornatus TaxID=947166 RepID=A0A1D1VT21_RAMVA|nr:hypothetical protein RvY_13395 [Ramazzottius varieornatus]
MPAHRDRVRHSSRVAESWQNFLAMMNNFSGGQELAFRQALFTAVGQFFLIVVLIVGYQVYFILQSFLKPLAWAALTGTILFPFKHYLTHGTRSWLQNLKSSSTPLVVGLLATPFYIVDRTFNYFGAEVLDFLWNHWMKLVWGAGVLAGCFFAQIVLWNHMDVLVMISRFFSTSLSFFRSKLIWLLVIPYIVAVNSLWTPEHRKTLRMLAWPLWIWLGLHLSSLLGALAAPVLVVVGIVLCLGFATEMKVVKSKIQRAQTVRSFDSPNSPEEELQAIASESSFWKVLGSSLHHLVNDSLTDIETHSNSSEDESTGNASTLPALKIIHVNTEKQGTRYLMYLFWMFVVVEVLSHYQFIPLILIPVGYRVVRVLGQEYGAWTALAKYLREVKNRCKGWVMSRKDIVAPAALRGLFRLAKQGDQKVMNLLEDTLDESISLLMVIMMFVAMGICGLIATMHVQQETVYMVGLSSDFMNETIVKHPEILQWLPEGAQVQETVQTAMDSLYMYGRDWMVGTLREAIADTNDTRAALIEKDILSLADRVYQFYLPRNRTQPVPHSFLRQTSMWGNRSMQHPLAALVLNEEDRRWSLVGQLNETWHKAAGALDWSNLRSYFAENMENIKSVVESIYAVGKGNFAMVFSLVTTILSILFLYFSALVHFIFCGLVFIAALYYLLCSSKDRYRPLDIVAVVSPSIDEVAHVGDIIEQTISDIFAASFKMAAFYGFFTWVLLSLFGVYVKFIPSVIASMLAVCPLVPPYVVCIPALCELWFLRGEYIAAILLVGFAITPSMFVDIAIYGDVKTAHPYLFGLSVAGGIIAMGLEGAVFGPVMLCILVVVGQVYRRILRVEKRGSIIQQAMGVGSASASESALNTPLTDHTRIEETLLRTAHSLPHPLNTTTTTTDSMKELASTFDPNVILESQAQADEKGKGERDSEILGDMELPRPRSLSTSKRRERLGSMGRRDVNRQSTPKEGAYSSEPDFQHSPIVRPSL